MAESRLTRADAMSGRSSMSETTRHVAVALSAEAVDVDVARHPRLLGNAQREPERLARLAKGLVARDQCRSRVRRVLLRAYYVEAVGGAQRQLALGDLLLLERDSQASAVDLGAAFRGHDGDDLIGEAEGEGSPPVIDREFARVLVQLVDADLIELLNVEEGLLDLEVAGVGRTARRGAPVVGKVDASRRDELVCGHARGLDAGQVLREGDACLRFRLEDLIEGDSEVRGACAEIRDGLLPRRQNALRRRHRCEEWIIHGGRGGQIELHLLDGRCPLRAGSGARQTEHTEDDQRHGQRQGTHAHGSPWLAQVTRPMHVKARFGVLLDVPVAVGRAFSYGVASRSARRPASGRAARGARQIAREGWRR